MILAVTKAAAAERDFVLRKRETTVSHRGLRQTCDWSESDAFDSFHSCNILKNVNKDNVNSRNVNSNNVNCSGKSHQSKWLIRSTNISCKGQEESYCHLERYCHICRVAERGADKMCANCRCFYYCSKSCQLKMWKQHKTVCDAISQLKVDREASVCKTGIQNATLPPSEQDQVVQLIGEKFDVACKTNDVATQVLLDTVAQASLLSHKWLESNLPGVKILSVGELLDPCDRLQDQWGNHTEIPFLGWIDLKFELSDESSSTVEEL